MSLFNKFFNTADNPDSEKKFPWLDLRTKEQLDVLTKESLVKPQLIFKHSTRCGISSMVKRQFEAENSFLNETANLYYLDLLKHRDVSNEIASRFDVYHESPQLLIVKNGKVLKHVSHGAINDLNLDTLL